MSEQLTRLEDLVGRASTRIDELTRERESLSETVRDLEGRLEEAAAAAPPADWRVERERVVDALRDTLRELRNEESTA